ncbi:MAG: hypothetical protein LBJ61_12385 [Deltaproteobacteria bacterium]|jgi:metal-dependent amidase/aminoacylase/carboxypeptidase family protein|nr:hypothetical protein [Deltaproteobacteria bacterium]
MATMATPPLVKAAVDLQIWASLPLGKMAIDDGVTLASMLNFPIKVEGRIVNTATAQMAVAPILVASQIVVGLQTLQSRELDPYFGFIVGFVRIAGGWAISEIWDEVELEGVIRNLFDDSGEGPLKRKTLG